MVADWSWRTTVWLTCRCHCCSSRARRTPLRLRNCWDTSPFFLTIWQRTHLHQQSGIVVPLPRVHRGEGEIFKPLPRPKLCWATRTGLLRQPPLAHSTLANLGVNEVLCPQFWTTTLQSPFRTWSNRKLEEPLVSYLAHRLCYFYFIFLFFFTFNLMQLNLKRQLFSFHLFHPHVGCIMYLQSCLNSSSKPCVYRVQYLFRRVLHCLDEL